jgi:thioredoxin 1
MASTTVMEFTDANFQQEVLSSSMPVVVDFWAEWCQPCRMLAPTIDALADEYQGKVKVGKLDTDANQQVPINYGISAIPTVIVFKGGEVAKKFVGLTKKEAFKQLLDSLT